MSQLLNRLRSAVLCAAVTATATLASASEVEYLGGSGVLPNSLPFSEAVRVDNTYYLSGQLGVKPGTLVLVPGGIREEARQTMENIAAVLAAQGLDMNDIVKCTVMLADMSEWGIFNEVYRSFFSQHYPARSAFGSTGLGLGARAEVECIAVASGSASE
ncbi:Rid family detoxifying hydrolase [Haliea sp. E1-2-M8]|uniref:Rid family detoxifying hydrolase n=1 Tax=Haliea sp. E1-2-M8 TaxID=3064706 RepID=UPI0027171997|nr:Rid family detoxifying hydrolase [Haliea sp. E1-2-M8]MDO8862927.1 Rid family detoxifying hydrolase [Haliea sp. E1-2-M8]